jgi:hypothetical protein
MKFFFESIYLLLIAANGQVCRFRKIRSFYFFSILFFSVLSVPSVVNVFRR